MEFLPFILFGVVFVVVVVWAIAKGRANRAARTRQFLALGFAPVPSASDAETLAGDVARQENNNGYGYRVTDPMRASVEGKPVWFYTKERTQQGSTVSAYEFRFPLRRRSAEGLVLFYKPTYLAHGTTVTSIGSLATDGFDSQPDDLTRIEIPVDQKRGNLIGALGPAHRSLYDLVDVEVLAALEPVGDFGIQVVTCRDEWCTLANSSIRMSLDLGHLWPLVQRLVAF